MPKFLVLQATHNFPSSQPNFFFPFWIGKGGFFFLWVKSDRSSILCYYRSYCGGGYFRENARDDLRSRVNAWVRAGYDSTYILEPLLKLERKASSKADCVMEESKESTINIPFEPNCVSYSPMTMTYPPDGLCFARDAPYPLVSPAWSCLKRQAVRIRWAPVTQAASC